MLFIIFNFVDAHMAILAATVRWGSLEVHQLVQVQQHNFHLTCNIMYAAV